MLKVTKKQEEMRQVKPQAGKAAGLKEIEKMKKFENKNTGVIVNEDYLNSIILGDIIEMIVDDEEVLERVREIVNNAHGGAKEMRQALVAAFWDNDFIEVEE